MKESSLRTRKVTGDQLMRQNNYTLNQELNMITLPEYEYLKLHKSISSVSTLIPKDNFLWQKVNVCT